MTNNSDLFKIYSECGIPSTLAPHAQIPPHYNHKEYKPMGEQTAADI